jgi:RNA polymerase sigma factor (TIGR02999 family)
MQVVVIVQRDADGEQCVLNSGDTLCIGRSEEADLVCVDPTMSGVHCEIHVVDGEARIRDLESRNGVFVNGKRITEAMLHDGDPMLVGRTSFSISIGIQPAEAAAKPTDGASAVAAGGEGGQFAAAGLLPHVYDELHELARRRLAHERPGQTLQPTALVHEAYLRVVGKVDKPQWSGRGHFFAAAAEAMRRILIEKARQKKRTKHGGGRARVDLDSGLANAAEPSMPPLEEALVQLAEAEPLKAELVKLRFIDGLTLLEAARALGISSATAQRYWAQARLWLANALSGAAGTAA